MADEKILSRVEPSRKDFLKRVLGGAAFAAPVLATFSLGALTSRPAQAASANCPNCAPSATPEPTSAILLGTVAVGLGVAAYRTMQGKQAESADSKTAE